MVATRIARCSSIESEDLCRDEPKPMIGARFTRTSMIGSGRAKLRGTGEIAALDGPRSGGDFELPITVLARCIIGGVENEGLRGDVGVNGEGARALS